MLCPECGGEGSAACPRCGGSGGELQSGGGLAVCEVCEASGIVSCDRCDGTGTVAAPGKAPCGGTGEAEARGRDVTDVKRVSRILLDLKVAGNYLRQYPHLAEKVAAALEKSQGRKG